MLISYGWGREMTLWQGSTFITNCDWFPGTPFQTQTAQKKVLFAHSHRSWLKSLLLIEYINSIQYKIYIFTLFRIYDLFEASIGDANLVPRSPISASNRVRSGIEI